MALLNPATTLPTSSRDAQEIYDERMNAAQLLAVPQTWVSEQGEDYGTPALETKYPMSILGLKFTEAKGESNFRTIGEKECTLTVAEYKEGVEVELLKLMTNSFVAKRWADTPALMVQAEQIFKLKMIATALVANTETCGWDDLALFHDSHLCNPKDPNSSTFDNLQATTKVVEDMADLEEEITLMAEVLDINGDPLGVMPTHIGVPRQKFQKLKNVLKQDFIPSTFTPGAGTATMRNPYNDGSLTVVRMDQLTDENDFYLFDMNLIPKGVAPWIVAKLALQAAGFDQLGVRHWNMENSDSCRAKSSIAVSHHVHYGFKFLYPHAIRKVLGA
jgi:hypothetical protein